MGTKDKEQAKWFAFFLLVIILIFRILAAVLNSPEKTHAGITRVCCAPYIEDQQRDLSTPSSRLVGHWIGALPHGQEHELYHMPIDPYSKIGSFILYDHLEYKTLGFKVLSEDPMGISLTIREFWKYGDTYSPYDVELCVPKDGQSMTKRYIFEDEHSLGNYRYVDNKTTP